MRFEDWLNKYHHEKFIGTVSYNLAENAWKFRQNEISFLKDILEDNNKTILKKDEQISKLMTKINNGGRKYEIT